MTCCEDSALPWVTSDLFIFLYVRSGLLLPWSCKKKKKKHVQPLKKKIKAGNFFLSHQCKGTLYKILCDSHLNPRSRNQFNSVSFNSLLVQL